MYQYPPRSRSPSANSVISPGSTFRPGMTSSNSSASIQQQPSSYAQYYNQPASYYSQQQQQQHPSLHSYAPRSISNPHIASSSMARPNSLYNLSIMSPTPNGNKSAFTYTAPPPQSPLIQHTSAAFSSNASAYDSSASSALAPEYRRRSASASGIMVSDQLPPVVSTAPKPDRYHRRRRTGDSASVTSVTASSSVVSTPSASSGAESSRPTSAEPRPTTQHLSASADSVINYKKQQSALQKGLKNSASTPSLTDYQKPVSNPNPVGILRQKSPSIVIEKRSSHYASSPASPEKSTFNSGSSQLVLPSDSRRKSVTTAHSNSSSSSVRSALTDISTAPRTPQTSYSGTFGSVKHEVNTPLLRAASPGPTQAGYAKASAQPQNHGEVHSSKMGPPIKKVNASISTSAPVKSQVQRPPSASPPPPPSHISPANLGTHSAPLESPKSGGFGSKFKKAFGLGRSKRVDSAPTVNTGKRLFSDMKSERSFSLSSNFLHKDNSDSKSVFSVRSNASSASIIALKKVGSSIAKGFTRNKAAKTEYSRPPSMAMSAENESMAGTAAHPLVSHIVAEVEIDRSAVKHNRDTSITSNKKNDSLTSNNSGISHVSASDMSATSVSSTSIGGNDNGKKTARDAATSVESLRANYPGISTEMETQDASMSDMDVPLATEGENLAQGDTIFPKSLDLLTVENIRSTIERSKSLERRRSRRSAHREEVLADEVVPNATTIHVSEPASIDPSPDVPAPKSILKSSAASIRSTASNRSYEPNDEDMRQEASHTSSLTAADLDLKNLVTIEQDGLMQLDFEMSQLDLSGEMGISNDDISLERNHNDNPTSLTAPNSVKIDSPPEVTSDTTSVATLTPPLSKVTSNEEFEIETSVDKGDEVPCIVVENEDTAIAMQPIQEDESTPSPEQRPLQGQKTPRSQQIQYFEQPPKKEKTRRQKDHPQYHYHPIYSQRMSRYSASHHSRTPSFASSSSSGGRYNSPPPRSSTDGEESLKTPVSQSKNSSVSFSSRIVIYDTYGRGDYDRRPDLATCNRITPILAQQIKDELNTFKMEMDIHDESRRYTHFF